MNTLELSLFLPKLETRLNELLSLAICQNTTLVEAASYTVFSSAKRLRPKMLLAISGEAGLDIACALEFIHTYSLIHDDLPSMDNDDFRRGKLSLHKAFSEDVAILTGDFLLTYAFEIIANSPLLAPMKISLIQSMAKRGGSVGMVGGQILDMKAKTGSIDWEMYKTLVSKKTGSLFSTALECGAIIKNASELEKQTLIQFGEIFGLIYQIADDLEDLNPPSAGAILGINKIAEVHNNLIMDARKLLTLLPVSYPFLEEMLESFAYACTS